MAKSTPNKKAAATKVGAAQNDSAQPKTASNVGAAQDDSALREFFIDGLKDIYYAEKKIVKTLPKMRKAATTAELKQAFLTHTEQSQQQVIRLEEVFTLIGEKAKPKKCEAIEGLVKEGEEIIASTGDGTATRDVGLIMAAQKVEHYEIATYGGLATLADTLGLSQAAKLLRQTLEEEKETDTLLTEIAVSNVNYKAAQESESK